jgi:transketolase
VWRPCDDTETAVAWRAALESRDLPTALVLSRQSLAHQPRSDAQVAAIRHGGYVLLDPQDGEPEAIIIATGSEVGLAVAAARALGEDGRRVRVVSVPCTEAFAAAPAEWRDSVLPPSVRRRVAVEAGISDFWRSWVGPGGTVIGVDTFGESAPAADVFAHFGLTVGDLTTAVKNLF